jgi:hypothetical protein
MWWRRKAHRGMPESEGRLFWVLRKGGGSNLRLAFQMGRRLDSDAEGTNDQRKPRQCFCRAPSSSIMSPKERN